MKKLLLLLALCFSFSGCTSMLIGAAVSAISLTKFSFLADGDKVKATGENVGEFRIIEVEEYGFAIAYRSATWDVNESYSDVVLGLNCGFFTGSLQEDQEYGFTLDDNLASYPMFQYTETVVQESGDSTNNTFWFNATEGWFKVTKLNEKEGTISGRFVFKAVSDDPTSDKVVEITDGVFKNIPYILVQD